MRDVDCCALLEDMCQEFMAFIFCVHESRRSGVGSFKTPVCSFIGHSPHYFVYYKSIFNHEDGAYFSISDRKKREGKLSLSLDFFSLQLTLPIRNKNYDSYTCKPFTCVGFFKENILPEFENLT